MNKSLIFSILFLLLIQWIFPQNVENKDNTYPTPDRLFHVERSKNKNIICYDINLNGEGKWNSSHPVKIYWVNREEEPGKTNGLNFIQKKLAFGYKLHSHDGTTCIISLNACSDKKITITQKEKEYFCSMDINSTPSKLKNVYVKSKDGNSTKVEYVELYGTCIQTGKAISERIIP